MAQNKVNERHFQNELRAALISIAILFSLFLMFHTFSFDTRAQSITIASKAWSDFGAHIPLIRSFSKGANFNRLSLAQPIESPLFPNEPVRYHFGFYSFVGLLERLGMRLDYAVNIPSALGFFLMLMMIFVFSYALFSNIFVSILSVIFTLFNGSLSFIRFFADHPIFLNTPIDIVTNSKFPSFGPWDGGLISAFWTLNIYTNQRHLALAYGLSLLIIFMTLKKSKNIYIALIISILLYIHFPAALMATIFLAWIFLVEKNTRSTLFYSALWSLPTLFFLSHKVLIGSPIVVDYGYLIQGPLTIFSFLKYWFYNIGFHSIFIPLGILFSPRSIRRLIAFPLLLLFIIPNVYRLSPDMINNHKFFNFFMIIGSMFSAYAVVWFWKFFRKQISLIRPIGLISLIGITFFLVFSGIIDLFPIINDSRGSVVNSDKRQDILFFENHTNPNDVIANSTWFYHPASLAGRAIYSGYTYFTWSYGYNQGKREQELLSIYQAPNLSTLCSLLSTLTISYVELSKTPEEYIHPNLSLWNSIPAEYTNPDTFLRVYSKNTLCQN